MPSAISTVDRWLGRGPRITMLKTIVFALCLLPLAWLVWDGLHGNLGTNPVEEITHRTGDWTLRLLLITLTVTPARRLLGWNFLLRLRRMLGLSAFFYACLHFLTYVWFDQFFWWDEIAKDIVKRPFITVGFAAFVLLIPLAVTSTNAMMKRLGRRWLQLHRLVYVSATLGVLHYLWLVKADIQRPLIYGVLLAALLAYRAYAGRRRMLKAAQTLRTGT